MRIIITDIDVFKNGLPGLEHKFMVAKTEYNGERLEIKGQLRLTN